MPGENKRFSGPRNLTPRPELDIERTPEGGPELAKRNKDYGLTEPLSDTTAKTRKSEGVNPAAKPKTG